MYPCAPELVLANATNSLKTKKNRKNKSILSHKQEDLIKVLREKAVEIAKQRDTAEKFRSKMDSGIVQNHEHLSDEWRKQRRKERAARIKKLARKFEKNRMKKVVDEVLQKKDEVQAILDEKKAVEKQGGPKTPNGIIRISDLVGDDSDDDDDDDDDSEDSWGNGPTDMELEHSRKQQELLGQIAQQGISNDAKLDGKQASTTVPLAGIGGDSFAENGLTVPFVSPTIQDNTASFNHLQDIVDRDLTDQLVTQLTLKMGSETVNIIAYWQPVEDRLKFYILCFHRCVRMVHFLFFRISFTFTYLLSIYNSIYLYFLSFV